MLYSYSGSSSSCNVMRCNNRGRRNNLRAINVNHSWLIWLVFGQLKGFHWQGESDIRINRGHLPRGRSHGRRLPVCRWDYIMNVHRPFLLMVFKRLVYNQLIIPPNQCLITTRLYSSHYDVITPYRYANWRRGSTSKSIWHRPKGQRWPSCWKWRTLRWKLGSRIAALNGGQLSFNSLVWRNRVYRIKVKT